MQKDIGKVYAEGFSFFGMTNRLISHELKNILAIISETLGLINELLELSGTGIELEPGKLRSLSESVIEEVERANRIIRNMNIFAHSVDEFIRDVDIKQVLTLMTDFVQLDSPAKSVGLSLVEDTACVIYTSPFFLEQLMYQVFHFSLLGASPQNEIRISCESDHNGVRIVISGMASNIIGEFPTKRENMLAKVLSAKISLDTNIGELSIFLPKRIDDSFIQNLLTDD